MPSTKPQANPRPCKPLGELMAAAGGRAVTTCPDCGREQAFHVTNTKKWTGKRLRKCRFCGYAHDELVPKPVIVSETTFSRDEL